MTKSKYKRQISREQLLGFVLYLLLGGLVIFYDIKPISQMIGSCALFALGAVLFFIPQSKSVYWKTIQAVTILLCFPDFLNLLLWEHFRDARLEGLFYVAEIYAVPLCIFGAHKEFGRTKKRDFLITLILLILAAQACFLIYPHFQQTALIYVLVPGLLALLISLAMEPPSITVRSEKYMVILLLLSVPILHEGIICLLFAAPILLGFAGVTAGLVSVAKKEKNKSSKIKASAAVTLMILLGIEGVSPLTSFNREHEVMVEKEVPLSVAEVQSGMKNLLTIPKEKPFYLKIFPYPVAVLNNKDFIRVTYVAYKYVYWGKVAGSALFKITQVNNNHYQYKLLKDTSYVGHYIKWKETDIYLQPIDDKHTKVTCKIAYHRLYDPSWYFGPLQRYAVQLVAEELIKNVTTARA